jgi:transcription-repair coupling factor (superfamily II helicase)
MSDRLGSPSLDNIDVERVADAVRAGGIFCAEPLPLSALAYLAWSLHACTGRSLLWIADGPRTLDEFYEALRALKEGAALYPAWESLPGHGPPPHPDLVGDRLGTLARCAGGEPPPVITTCVQALMQKTLSRNALARYARTIETGQSVDPAELVTHLQAAGYEFQPELQSKGQAALRGGIVDAWPLTSPWPVRIEFFGPVIESLRTFDPADQRSRERIARATLSPAGEPDGELTSDLAAYLPPDFAVAWIEPSEIRRHAGIYETVIHGAGAHDITLGFAEVARRLESAGASLQLHIGLGGDAAQPKLTLGLEPFEGLPSAPGGSFRPDLLDDERRKLVGDLVSRLKDGWDVDMFFGTAGGRDRFLETFGRDLAGAGAFRARVGALRQGFVYPGLRLVALSESDFYGRSKELRGRYEPHGPRSETSEALPAPRRTEMEHIAAWTDLQPGDLVVHVEHGIGKYLGLFEIDFNGQRQEVLSIGYAGEAKLHLPVSQAHLLSRYVGVGKRRPELHALGGKRWDREKEAAEKAVQDMAAALLETQATRNAMPGHAFAPDGAWQLEFEASFPYRETPDQERAIAETKADMESRRPMDRLICGDVGYGKTEVAMRASFKAVMDGKQVALLVPTTVLAQQHVDTFTGRMAPYPVRIAMLSRFQTRGEQAEVLRRVAEGAVDIVIGTHRLVQSDVAFADLGLVIIDEEQRFGVRHKEHLKRLRRLVDVLTLTATPIPRTLYMSLTGARDLSTIQTAPVERLPVETVVAENTDEVVREAILNELNREGQVYFLHNRVRSIHAVQERLNRLVPEARVEVAHGQMGERTLSAVMRAFVRGDFDVLLCTTIIESGLDIPNVNTILIDRADRFGMADLYQLRGRVGRYKRKAFAYLLLPRHGRLFDTARKRIGAIKRYSHLGAGFKLALRDLEIRGAGNLLGAQQSGHIAAVGFDLYCQLLRRSVALLRGEKPPPIIDVEVKLDFIDLSPTGSISDHTAVIPLSYVEDENLRIDLYRRLAGAATTEDIEAIRAALRDRFGKLPDPVDRLLKIARLRTAAAAKKISRIEVSEEKVMMTRHRDFIMNGGRFPRLHARGASSRLDELIRIVEGAG